MSAFFSKKLIFLFKRNVKVLSTEDLPDQKHFLVNGKGIPHNMKKTGTVHLHCKCCILGLRNANTYSTFH
jgi:hypothetical protein